MVYLKITFQIFRYELFFLRFLKLTMYLFFFPLQSSVCGKIMELLGQNKIDHHQRQVAILSQDSFYKVLTPEQKAKALKGQFNFDHPGNSCVHWELKIFIFFKVILESVVDYFYPLYSFVSLDAFDNELIIKTLWDIMEGRTVEIPVYDFVTHSR